MFGNAIYRNHEYKLVTHARAFALLPKEKINNAGMLFISSALSFLTERFGYSNMCLWSKIQNKKIKLPQKNEKIDFEFMENFIAELEAQRIAELEAYLKVTGLDNYILTKKEEKTLEALENKGGVELREYKIIELFEIEGTKSLDRNAIEFVKNGINFVGRTNENNGVQGKIVEQVFKPNEPNTITATVIGNYKYVKYQKEPYYCSQNINKLTPRLNLLNWNDHIARYFITLIQKFVSQYDGQQGGYKLDDIINYKIYLPIKNNEIDFEFMENLISAVQKLVIKGVVEYADKRIKCTKEVVEKNN